MLPPGGVRQDGNARVAGHGGRTLSGERLSPLGSHRHVVTEPSATANGDFAMSRQADRMPPLPAAQWTAERKAAVEAGIKGPRGHLVGPFIVLMRSPEFMNRLQRTGEYLRFSSALEPRLSELAILITARTWTQQFEWHHHIE